MCMLSQGCSLSMLHRTIEGLCFQNIYKVLKVSSPSDMMKSSCWLDESLSSNNKCSVPKNLQTA